MASKTFVLGVGCQKGGSSWLHAQFKNQRNFDMGFRKEYHVFDTMHIAGCEHVLKKRLDKLSKLVTQKRLMTPESPRDLLKMIDFCRDHENYYDYFDYLYQKSEETEFVGDITPAYCGLSQSVLRTIRNRLQSRGFTVKVIFLMRDPVERIWSQVRMQRRAIEKGQPNHQFKRSEEEMILSSFDSWPTEFRTRYETTIRNLEAVFQEEHLFYEVYERLFRRDSICKLEQFLHTQLLDVDLDERVNASPKKVSLSSSTIEKVARFYRSTYRYCAQRFDTDSVWPNSPLAVRDN